MAGKHKTLLTILASALAFSALVPNLALAQDEWSATGSDSRTREIIRRYRTLLERRPNEGRVLDRLLEEVGTGRGLQALIEDYERMATAEPGEFAYQMILGHLYKRTGRVDEAIEAYTLASEIEPENSLPWISLADAYARAERIDEARDAYERALEMTSDSSSQEEILFALADIAFSQRDFDEATSYFTRLVDLNPRDAYLRTQLADTLVEYGRYQEAIEQYEAIADLAGRDQRQRAMAIGTIGDILVELGETDQAVERYREAQGYARRGTWLWDDLEQRIIEAFRLAGDLATLVAFYEEEWSRPSSDETRILAELYLEVGRQDDALVLYQQLVEEEPDSIDARLDLIRIYDQRGEIEDVIEQYEAILAMTDEPIHFFQLAQIQRSNGDEASALATLQEALERFQQRPSVLSQVADRYLRWGHREQAEAIYQRLVELEPDNPDYLIALGEFQYMEGRLEEAISTWDRLLEIIPDRAQAQTQLARVYADHGMISDAITLFEQASEADPENELILEEMAEVYEESSRYQNALDTWSHLADVSSDPYVQATARSRIISIQNRQGVLRDRLGDMLVRFNSDPTDIYAGLFLGEAYLALEDFANAEFVLIQLLEVNGDQMEALNHLSDLYVSQNRIDEAIEVLERAAAADPYEARDIYYQIVDLCLIIFDDSRAISFAQLAIEQNPNDARGYYRLGRVYWRMGQLERAVTALEEAMRLDRRDFQTALDLAQVYEGLERYSQADELYRQVIRRSRDRSEIAHAGQRAIVVNQMVGTLDDLLRDLESLLYRPDFEHVSRRLAIEVIQRMVEPQLAELALGSDDRPGEIDIEALALRSNRTLLTILNDTDPMLRVNALVLLGHLLSSESTGAVSLALQDEEDFVRAEAAFTLGLIADSSVVDALIEVTTDPSSSVRSLAAWALGEIGDVRGVHALLGVLTADENPSVQAMAALSLGRIGDPQANGHLVTVAAEGDDNPQWAAVWALGAIADPSARDTLEVALRLGSPRLQRFAAWSLGRLGPTESTISALLTTMWSGNPENERAAELSLRQLNSGGTDLPSIDAEQFWDRQFQLFNVRSYLGELSTTPLSDLPQGGTYVLTEATTQIIETLEELLISLEGTRIDGVLLDLSAAPSTTNPQHSGVSLGLLTINVGDDLTRIDAAVERIGLAISPNLVALLDSEHTSTRRLATRVLGRIGAANANSSAVDALIELAEDSGPALQAEAVWALGEIGDGQGREVIERLLASHSCEVRAAAAVAYGALTPNGAARLETIITTDECVEARVGAAIGLGRMGGDDSVAALESAIDDDSDFVRAEVARHLQQSTRPTAQQILEILRADPSAAVRTAAMGDE